MLSGPYYSFQLLLSGGGIFIDLVIFDAQYNALKVIGMCMASLGLFSKFLALYIKWNEPATENLGLIFVNCIKRMNGLL